MRCGAWRWSAGIIPTVVLLTACPPPATEEEGSATATAPAAPSPSPTPPPDEAIHEVDFRIHPSDVYVPLGGTQVFLAADLGVPVQGVTWSFPYSDPLTYGSFDPAVRMFQAPGDIPPEGAELQLEARWTDPWGTEHTAAATLRLSRWRWSDVGGPGPGCEECPRQMGLTQGGAWWFSRGPAGIWINPHPEDRPPPRMGGSSDGGGDCLEEDPDPEVPSRMAGARLPDEEPTVPPPLPTQEATPAPVHSDFHNSSGTWLRAGRSWSPDASDLALLDLSATSEGSFLGLSGGVLYRSPDFGQSWATLEVPGVVTAMASSPSSSDVLVVALRSPSGLQRLARSGDGGRSWEVWTTNVTEDLTHLSMVPLLSTRILAASETSLYVSSDDGRTFERTWTGGSGAVGLYPALLGRAWAQVRRADAGLTLVSSDAGGTWSEINPGGCEKVNSVGITPGQPDRMWVGCEDTGPLLSTDGGEHWDLFTQNLSLPRRFEVEVLASIPTVMNLRYDGQDHFWLLTEDPGEPPRWVAISGGPGPDITALRAGTILRPDPESEESDAVRPLPAILAANRGGWLEASVSPEVAVWISHLAPLVRQGAPLLDVATGVDGGAAMAVLEGGIVISSVTFDLPWQEELLGAGGEAVSVDLWPDPGYTPWVAVEDGGASAVWTRDEEGWLRAGQVQLTRVRSDGLEGGSLFGLSDDGRLWVSDDGGRGWTSVDEALGGASALALSASAGEVFIGSSDGIFRVEGGRWERDGLEDQVIQAVAVVPPFNEGEPAGLAAAPASGGMLFREGGSERFERVDGLNFRPADGGEPMALAVERAAVYPGGMFVVVKGEGLFQVLPAPVQEIADPEAAVGEEGEGGADPCLPTPPPPPTPEG